MSISTMSQYPLPFAAPMPAYIDSQYVRNVLPMMESNLSSEICSRIPHGTTPPSPSSSTSEFRVSKAKKGKRVHACEFAGCTKVFTRAEHRRRHELSHRNKKTYTCSYEGCTKAFHRADYLTQHMARHEPQPKIKRSQSVTSNSTSSITSTLPSQVYSAESQALTGYQSPVASVSPGTPNAGDQLMNMCSHCINCQPRLHGTHNSGNHLYSYSTGSDLGFSSSQSSPSGPPPGFEAIDQYLRSVLRPEAFQPLAHPQEQMNSSFWPPNIDPNLSQMNTSNFQHPTSYTWTSGTESLLRHIQPSHQLPQSRASQERNT